MDLFSIYGKWIINISEYIDSIADILKATTHQIYFARWFFDQNTLKRAIESSSKVKVGDLGYIYSRNWLLRLVMFQASQRILIWIALLDMALRNCTCIQLANYKHSSESKVKN